MLYDNLAPARLLDVALELSHVLEDVLLDIALHGLYRWLLIELYNDLRVSKPADDVDHLLQ